MRGLGVCHAADLNICLSSFRAVKCSVSRKHCKPPERLDQLIRYGSCSVKKKLKLKILKGIKIAEDDAFPKDTF